MFMPDRNCQNRGSSYGLPDVDRASGRGYEYDDENVTAHFY